MLSPLLSVQEMPIVAGLNTPAEFYIVTRKPAPLAGMAYPKPDHPWTAVLQMGIRHVVQLEMNYPLYDPSPLNLLHAAPLEDLVQAKPPRDPKTEQSLVVAAVAAILGRLEKGEGVAVHCAGGTGRTGTVLGCCLVGLGYPAHEVIGYLDQLNKARGRRGWPESVWQSELVIRFNKIGFNSQAYE